MRQWACVLLELAVAHDQRILDPLHGVAVQVARKGLIAEHGQPLFQAQLEPVAASDPVAGPVVKILVGDDRLDPLKVGVG